MLLTFMIQGQQITLDLNWQTSTWQVDDDRGGVWSKEISTSQHGVFQSKTWDVLWINDQSSSGDVTRIIVRNAPRTSSDGLHLQGQARIFQPKRPESALRDTVVPWCASPGSLLNVEKMTEIHTVIVGRLKEIFKNAAETPIVVGDSNYNKICPGIPKPKIGTNCYALGTGLALIVGQHKGLKKESLEGFVASKSLSATTGLPGRAGSSWKDADGTILPAPGSFFALLSEGISNSPENRKRNLEIAHVSTLLEYRDNQRLWVTADFGQDESPGGTGRIRHREYNLEYNTLTSPHSNYGERVLAGWVNVGEHFA